MGETKMSSRWSSSPLSLQRWIDLTLQGMAQVSRLGS
jgi:hypothetical protein